MRYAIISLLFALACTACQKPLEPDPEVAGVRVTLRVVDQGGGGIGGVLVRYAKGERGNRSTIGITDVAGMAATVIQVPTGGIALWLEVIGRGTSGNDTMLVTGRRVEISCRDSIYTIEVPRTTVVACDGSATLPDKQLSVSICRGSKTVCSERIAFDCAPVAMWFTAGARSIPGGDLFINVNDSGVPLAPGGTGRVDLATTGSWCEVCMKYAAASQASSGGATVAVEATPGGKPRRKLFDITFKGTTSCDSCACPTVSAVRYPAAGADTLCLDTTASITVDLGAVVNSNLACALAAHLARGPKDGALRVLSLGGASLSQDARVGAGGRLGALELSVTPGGGGAIDDEVLISLRTEGSSAVYACDTLRVGLHFYIRPPVCPLKLSGDLIVSQSPLKTMPITSQVCSSSSRVLTIINPSEHCPVRISNMSLEGIDTALFNIGGRPPIRIAPLDSIEITVVFSPTCDVYIQSGTPPRMIYNAELVLETDCGITTVPLIGKVRDPDAVPARLFENDCVVDSNTAFVILGNGSVNTNQSGDGRLAVVVDAVFSRANPRSAVVKFGQLYARVPIAVNPASAFCGLRNDPAVKAASIRALGSDTTKAVSVQEGDLFVLNYEYNGCRFGALLWVEQIEDVGPTRACQQVQFRICSPIVCLQ